MAATTHRKVLFSDPELLITLRRFLDSFETVFGERDWWLTREAIAGPLAEHNIHPNGTFLEPGVEDESNNWANRGSLLSAYRRLKHQLAMSQFIVTEIHRCGGVTMHPRHTDIDDETGIL